METLLSTEKIPVDEFVKILDKLCDPSKLERDRSEEKLLLIDFHNDTEVIISWILKKFSDMGSVENCLGSLSVCKIFLNKCNDVPSDFLEYIAEKVVDYQLHTDYRVRICAGECMGLICRLLGLKQFVKYTSFVKNGIKTNLPEQQSENVSINVKHDSEKSKSLEAWMKCFQEMVNGINEAFENIVDDEMLFQVFDAINRGNRFIRETGYYLLGTITENHGCTRNKEMYVKVCKCLRKGLGDNWSQVRMAASVATRQILMSKKEYDVDEKIIHSILLPGICINRYYLAEGVKLYNQETWKIVVGDKGKELIENHIEETVSFYIKQSTAENHAVRETACSCISEIALKLNKDTVRPYLVQLLDTLIILLNDPNWSVRDMACLTCGRLIATFPMDTKQHRPDVLIPLICNHVTDNVICGRESGAYSIANIVGAFNSKDTSYLKDVVGFILENLENIKHQKAESSRFSEIEQPLISNANKCSINQCDYRMVHQDKYRSEILSPSRHIDYQNIESDTRLTIQMSEPWEKADGCILLIAELALRCKDSYSYMDELISAMIKACGYQHYPNYVYVLATTCKAISDLCACMDKPRFKKYLSDFLPIIYISLCSNCEYTVSIAENTIRVLISKVGSNILKGRIEMYNNDLLLRTQHLFSV